jgi:hypothetical protein
MLPIAPLDLGAAVGHTPLESLALEWSVQLSPAVAALYSCVTSCQEVVRNAMLSRAASVSPQAQAPP